jgi:hypothetical protein
MQDALVNALNVEGSVSRGFEAVRDVFRALIANPGTALPQDETRIYARNLEVPSGVVSARRERLHTRTANSRQEGRHLDSGLRRWQRWRHRQFRRHTASTINA